MSRPRRRIIWPVLAVLTLLMIAGCGLFGLTTCNPPDRVTVRVNKIPPEMSFLSLAAETRQGPVSLLWSMTHLGLPFEMHPADYRVEGEPPRINTNTHVRWQSGNKYGVVMQTKKGEWRVAWFPAAEVPLQERTLLGGGKVEFDLSKAEVVPLDADTVKALGLQDVKPLK